MNKDENTNMTDSNEAQIQADVDALKAQYPVRKDLSVATAKLLFFKYDRMPTVALIRQYTQLGSTTNINTDLKSFWGVVRAKLKLNVIAPDVPEGLVEYAGEMMSSFWARASEDARKALDGERAEIEALRQADRQAVDMAQYERDKAIERANSAADRVLASESERENAERALAVEREAFATKEANYLERIAQLEQSLNDSEKARLDAEGRFTQELKEERLARERSEEFLTGQNKHAMMQIEEARQQTREEKERLRAQKADFDLKENILRQQINGLREEFSRANNTVAEYKARFESANAERDRLVKQNASQADTIGRLNSAIEELVLQSSQVNSDKKE